MRKTVLMMPALIALASFSVASETVLPESPSNDTSVQAVTPMLASQEEIREETALDLLMRFQHAFHHLNYELAYIEVRQGHIEPVRFIHGLVDDVQISHRVYLNGPAHEAVYRANKVAYFEAGQPPYSLTSKRLPGIFGNLAALEAERLSANYELVIAGKSRVAGRPAQVMRIVPKSADMYGLYLWLDFNSALPLRIDIVDRQGDLVEQHMAVSLIEFSKPNEWMQELASIDLPSVVTGANLDASEELQVDWQLGWKPVGMEVRAREQHSLVLLSESVDYMQLGDGLFDVSVYINPIGTTSPLREHLVRQGATSLHTVVRNGIEITVVGEIPPETASRIADSVKFSPRLEQP
ncbi:MucB/RseB C-terminal domain-containing protein [Aliagarivorans taiwanensis]|uniref:MucB/RseB C-terminal domain-containing protein n=1 Tax=Aliagarivorans taiwanensis TaxID=561966 RepID=UPI00047D783B|nr:MucB/RseB C-terminal domain-containing protein [Aliagarivorans taiwanensis]